MRFRYGQLIRPAHDWLRHLWQSQSNLTNLQLDFSRNAPSIAQIVREDAAAIRSLKSVSELELKFGVEPISSSDVYDKLFDMTQFPKLEKVTLLGPEHWETNEGKPLMDRIMKRALPTSLTHISLSYISLPTANAIHLDEYHSLKHLELHEHYDLGLILDPFRRPNLTSFAVCFNGGEGSPAGDLAVINRFLPRFRSLNRLIVDCNLPFNWDEQIEDLTVSIASHSDSLRSLLINLNPVARPLDPFVDIPLRCEQLCQLVIPAGILSLLDQCQVSLSTFWAPRDGEVMLLITRVTSSIL